MSNVTRADNLSSIEGKWFPYYYKPFYLGTKGNSDAEDGTQKITLTAIGSAPPSDVALKAWCTHPLNCGFKYTIKFAGSYKYWVIKKDLNGDVVNTIYASSTSGNGRYWRMGSRHVQTIDLGVIVQFPSDAGTEPNANDEITIEMPTFEQMQNKKFYHGGYSTFLRVAQTSDVAYKTDILPENLKGKNISLVSMPGYPNADNTSGYGSMALSYSHADYFGNVGQSIYMEWNLNKDGASQNVLKNNYAWVAGETWSLGPIFSNDNEMTSTLTPIYASIPASDVTTSAVGSGEIQASNVQTAARQGYARFGLGYIESGTEVMYSHNQLIPIIIMLS